MPKRKNVLWKWVRHRVLVAGLKLYRKQVNRKTEQWREIRYVCYVLVPSTVFRLLVMAALAVWKKVVSVGRSPPALFLLSLQFLLFLHLCFGSIIYLSLNYFFIFFSAAWCCSNVLSLFHELFSIFTVKISLSLRKWKKG